MAPSNTSTSATHPMQPLLDMVQAAYVDGASWPIIPSINRDFVISNYGTDAIFLVDDLIEILNKAREVRGQRLDLTAQDMLFFTRFHAKELNDFIDTCFNVRIPAFDEDSGIFEPVDRTLSFLAAVHLDMYLPTIVNLAELVEMNPNVYCQSEMPDLPNEARMQVFHLLDQDGLITAEQLDEVIDMVDADQYAFLRYVEEEESIY